MPVVLTGCSGSMRMSRMKPLMMTTPTTLVASAKWAMKEEG
jgi:hypothetical protein